MANTYQTQDGSLAHVQQVTDGVSWGSIEQHGIVTWRADGRCLTGYNGWDLGNSVLVKPQKPRLGAPQMEVYPGAISGLSPSTWWDRQGYTGPITGILHGTAGGGSGKSVFQYFLDPTVGKCTHFVIDFDGMVYQLSDVHWAAAGNGSCTSTANFWNKNVNGNWYTWSIEIFKTDTNNAMTPTEAQYQTLFKLVPWICERTGTLRKWPTDNQGGITSHSFFDPVHRPGNLDPNTFDWDRFYSAINGGGTTTVIGLNSPNVGDYYIASPDHPGYWQRKNALDMLDHKSPIYLHGGILESYCKWPTFHSLAGLSELGLVLTNEFAHEKDAAGNVIYCLQLFERGCVAYDPKHLHYRPLGAQGACYVMPLETFVKQFWGAETEVYRTAITAAVKILSGVPL